MTDHPITPPPELFKQWEGLPRSLAFEAAYRAGADAELEACCEWLSVPCPSYGRELRLARRPKPPSLKEQALETLRSMQIEPFWINGVNTNAGLMSKYDTIRRALEQLDA